MSNTYFKIAKEEEYKSSLNGNDYSNKYELSLTAFMGGEDNLQLTVRTESTLPSQNGIAYITLSNKDIDLLIAGLLERKLGVISSTGYEQSKYSPAENIEE